MSDAATEFLPVLGRTTLWLIVASSATATILHLARATWPAAHRVGWVVTLLAGWTFLRLPVAIPWYEAPQKYIASTVVAQSDFDAAADTIVAAPLTIRPMEMPLPLAGESGDGHRGEALVGEPSEGLPRDDLSQTTAPIQEIANPAAFRFDWPLAVLVGWAIGVVGLVAAWLVGYARFVRSLPPSLMADPAWLDQWGKLLAAAGVRRSIPLRATADLGPMLCRLPRGYELLVPADLWREMEIGQRGAILRHELAHYLRGDVWKSLAARVLALPHWFNPISWWAVRRFEEAAEWACDRAATVEGPPTTYAKALVLLGAQAAGPAAYGSAARGPALAVRIRQLLNSQAKEDSTMKKTLLVATALCLAAVSLVRLQLVAKEPAPAEEPGIVTVELNRSDSDQTRAEPAAPAQAAEPAAPSAETMQLEKKRIAEQLAEALTKRSRIVSDLHRTKLKIIVAEARNAKPEDARPVEEQVEVLVNQDPQIVQATNRLGLYHQLMADEVAKGGRGDDPRIKALSAKIDAIEQKLEDRKALMRPQLLEELNANPPNDDQPTTPLSVLEKEKLDLEHSLQEAEKSVQDLALSLQILEEKSAGAAAHRARSDQEAGAVAKPQEGEPSSEPVESAKSPTVGAENLEIERKALELEKAREALESTERMLRKGYVTKGQRDAQAFEVKRAESDLRVAQAKAKAAETSQKVIEGARLASQAEFDLRAAETAKAAKGPAVSQKMVEQAHRAFEATLAAYESETTTLESVYEWSLRWMAAAEGVASNDQQKAEAIRAHLERMRDLQKKIEKLYQTGTKGGDAKEMAAANFYVAEAEGRLAEAFATSGMTSVSTLNTDISYLAPTEPEIQRLDLKIKIAEMEGELKQTYLQLERGVERSNRMKKLGNAVSDEALRQLQEEIAKLESRHETLRKQLELYKSKLKLYERATVTADSVTKPATAALAKATTPTPPVKPRATSEAKKELRYDGKAFDAWAEELRDDLSPERRREAIWALATFGANGYGPQAAAEILRAMRGYSVSNIDGSLDAILAAAAVNAFGKIPPQDALPSVIKAFKSDNANERLFAVAVFPSISTGARDGLPMLLGMLKDPDIQVRRRAMFIAAAIDPERPELLPALREALASEEQSVALSAIRIVSGGLTLLSTAKPSNPTIPALIPELVGLLNSADDGISGLASRALMIQFGAAAIPDLEKAVNAEDSKEKATKAEETLKNIRERAAKEAK